MELKFEYGDSMQPKGHAFVYFSSSTGKTFVSYLMLMPVKVEVQKYIPPFLMGQVGDLTNLDTSMIVFPPSPEEVSSREQMFEVARVRGDDVVNGGAIDEANPSAGMGILSVIGRHYAELCDDRKVTMGSDTFKPPKRIETLVYDALPPEDKLAKLSTLVGKLLYAGSGGSDAELSAVEDEIKAIAKTFPTNFKLEKLVEYGTNGDKNSRVMAELYLERAYKLHFEDYRRVQEIEEKLRKISPVADP